MDTSENFKTSEVYKKEKKMKCSGDYAGMLEQGI